MVVVLFVFCSALWGFFRNLVLRTSKAARSAALFLACAFALGGGWATAFAGTQPATSTALAVTSGGNPVTSVPSGSVVTLKASVTAGGTPVTVGQVNFCEALATYCTDIHVLGPAQLTSAGTAELKFRPGIGSHSYKAVFAGTNTYAGQRGTLLPAERLRRPRRQPVYHQSELGKNPLGDDSRAPPSAAAATPTFSVAAGTYAAPQTVTITDSTPGAAIYVTPDGSAPTTAGQGDNGPINVSGSVTIRAIPVGRGYLAGGPASAAYTIPSPPAAVINTVAGTGVSGFSGSGGAAASAQVGPLAGVAVDGSGNLYFADIIRTVAGNGNNATVTVQ
jgi:hypothetical protein